VSLQFLNIRHAYGANRVLDGVSLEAKRGDIMCLLGPSGCGKSTLLRLAAGLLALQDGEVRLDEELMASPKALTPPEKRPVGLVFQEGALFPHLNVTDNVIFGVQRHPDRAALVRDLIEQVGLSDQAKSFPDKLSGGQQQRVALARALAPSPAVLLLDEPFASVDIVLRRQLRDDTRALLKERDSVAVMVTHDPEEALEIADHIAVMADGKIVQAGSPAKLFDEPANADVALMFGDGHRVMGQRQGRAVQTPFGTWPLESCVTEPASDAIAIVVRPDAVGVTAGNSARLTDLRPYDRQSLKATLAAPSGEVLSAFVPREAALTVGQTVQAAPMPKSVFAFDR